MYIRAVPISLFADYVNITHSPNLAVPYREPSSLLVRILLLYLTFGYPQKSSLTAS